MKTAAQQIGAYKLLSENKPTAYDEALLLSMIEEAERRAEQRVRAEIARDSERLDWLQKSAAALNLNTTHHIQKGWGFRLNGKFGKNIRQAIDAAREVG